MDHQAIAQMLGNYGEFIGSLAILVTLGYLTLQIRQQRMSNSVVVKNSVLEGFNRVNELLASDEGLATLFNRGLWFPDELTDGEAAQFTWILRLFAARYLKLFQLHHDGVVNDSEWENHAMQAAYIFGRPGGKLFVEGHRGSFDDFIFVLTNASFGETAVDTTLGREVTPGR